MGRHPRTQGAVQELLLHAGLDGKMGTSHTSVSVLYSFFRGVSVMSDITNYSTPYRVGIGAVVVDCPSCLTFVIVRCRQSTTAALVVVCETSFVPLYNDCEIAIDDAVSPSPRTLTATVSSLKCMDDHLPARS